MFFDKKKSDFQAIRFMLCFGRLRIVYLKMDGGLVVNIEISRAYDRTDMLYLFILKKFNKKLQIPLKHT